MLEKCAWLLLPTSNIRKRMIQVLILFSSTEIDVGLLKPLISMLQLVLLLHLLYSHCSSKKNGTLLWAIVTIAIVTSQEMILLKRTWYFSIGRKILSLHTTRTLKPDVWEGKFAKQLC